MTYIERLQNDKRVLIDYYNATKTVEERRNKFENTSYKGDAAKALQVALAARAQTEVLVMQILNRKSSKEAVND